MIKHVITFIFLTGLSMANSFAIEVKKTNEAITIDGINNEKSWQKVKWHPLDQHILGDMPSKDDFSGKFKLLWDAEHLYLLAEITDDVLFDQHADPLKFYWDDDCLEVFIDEDKSGGNHQFNFNAFAYHVALDNQSVDIGKKLKDGSPEFLLLNEHVTSQWRRSAQAPHNVIWELAIKVFDDSYSVGKQNKPVKLSQGKKMGFMLAYCDNDGSKTREHFIGSTAIKPVNGDKNLGYINASVFDEVILTNND